MQNLYKNQSNVGSLTEHSFYDLKKIIIFDFLYSGENFMQGLFQLLSLFIILRTFGRKTVLLIADQLFIDYSLVKDLYSFYKKYHVEKFTNYLNILYKHIKEDRSLPFIDIKISREDNELVTQFTVATHHLVGFQIF